MNFRPSNYCSVPTPPPQEYLLSSPVKVYFRDDKGKLGQINVGKVDSYAEAISAVREAINQPRDKHTCVLSSIQGGKQ